MKIIVRKAKDVTVLDLIGRLVWEQPVNLDKLEVVPGAQETRSGPRPD